MRWLFLLYVVASGCTPTLTARTGRILEDGETVSFVAGGAVYTPDSAAYDYPSPGDDADADTDAEPSHTYPYLSVSPQLVAGGRLGLGEGWEVHGGVTLPGLLGGFVGVRKGLVDTGRLALAIAVDATASGFYFASAEEGASMVALSARTTVDASLHFDEVALYASPGWMAAHFRHTVTDSATEVSETAAVPRQLLGCATGLRLGRQKALYFELGYWRTLGDGEYLLSPAVGFEFGGEDSP